MKLEVPLLAGLLFFATQLLARAQVQGFEAALASSGMEYGFRAVRAGSKFLRHTLGMHAQPRPILDLRKLSGRKI